MEFNPSKCNAINITRKKKKLHYDYTLHHKVLDNVTSTKYLGVHLSSDLSWRNHINHATSKANQQLAFIRRNLQINNMKIKEAAYKGLVRPVTEYCAPIWDPHHKKYITQLEAIQRRAARFVCNNYDYRASVTEMIDRLNWESLAHRRLISRLTMLFKIEHNLVAVTPPALLAHPQRPRPGHPHAFQVVYVSTEAYKNSFYIRTICQWNSLPSSVACQNSLECFQTALSSFYP